jgi:carnitine O-acetyltransferase
LGTFDNEVKLPRVPLPTIADTGARFLSWCAPLLDDDQLRDTRKSVAEFEADETTRELQEALAAYDKSEATHGWLDEFWRDRYLGRRDRIALNANFFFLFDDTDDDQITRAVRLIAASVEHKQALDAGTFTPVVRRGKFLSMEQHKYLFSTTRIPGVARDGVRAAYGASLAPVPGPRPATWQAASNARHIVAFVRGNMFRVDVIGPTGIPHTLAELADALRAVMAAGAARGQGVGSLTSKERAEWARSRAALLDASPANRAALEDVETALFCVCLEDEAPAATADKCKRLLAGDPGNRWFDKGVSFIVFPDGSAGFNGEHCLLDGTTIVEFIDTVLAGTVLAGTVLADTVLADTAEEHSGRSGAAARGAPAWRPITFALTDRLTADVDSAAAEYVRYGEQTAGQAVSLAGFGSDAAKRLWISPDAFAQLAYQLAHRRSKGFTGATYESIATRHFAYGRTEAMRVVTPEMVAFVEAMDDPSRGRAERVAALRRAGEAHVARARECQAGLAPEQHLWELQLLARRRGIAWEPALYSSPGWVISRDDYLSTSAAGSTRIQYFGFGATSTHCIGVAYILLPGRLNVYLSTPRSVGAEMSLFASALPAAMAEMSDLLGGE